MTTNEPSFARRPAGQVAHQLGLGAADIGDDGAPREIGDRGSDVLGDPIHRGANDDDFEFGQRGIETELPIVDRAPLQCGEKVAFGAGVLGGDAHNSRAQAMSLER
jgi:hypothetical protein